MCLGIPGRILPPEGSTCGAGAGISRRPAARGPRGRDPAPPAELRMRSDELNTANAFLASILTGLEVAPHYSAAKGAILAFTRAVARDAASRGIRVNAICPGYIDTPMTRPASPLVKAVTLSRTPLGRFGEVDEIARTALFLVSDDSSFFTGQWLSPNGGLFIG